MLLAAGALALAACQQPMPSITVHDGAKYVDTKAVIYCFDGQSASDNNCRRDTDITVPTVTTRSGPTLGIAVPKDVAEHGWIVAAGTTRLTPVIKDRTYYRLSLAPLTTGSVELQVRALEEPTEDSATRGIWVLRTTVDNARY